ncbi:hypothetical protein AB0B71_01235 [Micromonospora echinofusca]|uniref:hypothetical protein n=1 Tax=Micromonospora echinofusca TaxID=47858 RepID=UPI0033DEED6D
MTPAELEAIRTSDPERYEALTGPQRDRQLAAAAARRGYPLYSSEHGPRCPTPYKRQASAEREAARAIGETAGLWIERLVI